ncbi:aldo/keto reductase [Candidatus Obscuribacterales bacterium]|nr:aldo/keto reductase [Candidatus Obscuribacterales bacterium]
MTLTAYNNVSIPSFMYGTAWKKDATTKLVETAVEAGFVAIDTANQLIHYDEARVGEALLNLAQKGINREKLFLQTKFTSVNGQDHRTPYDASANLTTQVNQSFESSLKHLHTDYLDSYVLHGPYSRHGLTPADWEVWAAIEEHYNAGKTKMIGVSNVSAEQLEVLCAKAKVKPMVVQNRCYAVMGWDREVRDICRENGIIYQGFSLLTANARALNDPIVRTAAKRLGATAAQVIFKFSMEIGMSPLTGTTSLQHMKEDLDSVNLSLTSEEIAQIESVEISSVR